MKVQTKVLLLLGIITALFVGGLIAFRVSEARQLRALAAERAAKREQDFTKFLEQHEDRLNVFVDDMSVWDAMVQALRRGDAEWAGENVRDETLTTYGANAVWMYRPDQSLVYSLNNRYSDGLKELPLPAGAIEKIFAKARTCHFFLHTSLGWMEIRGATVHPSQDRFRETRPEGYFFAGQFWLTDDLRRIAQFTGYELHVEPATGAAPLESAEETGHVRFARAVPGWDGQPVAYIVADSESPVIRELNASSRRLISSLLGYAAVLILLIAGVVLFWVRGPLRGLAESLTPGRERELQVIAARKDEFGMLAERMLAFRRTEEKLEVAEEQLRHGQKLEAVGRLAGGVAHDFNNLLTAILGYSQLLERRLVGDPTALEQIRLVFQAGQQAAGLTRQLLAFSRKQMLQPKVVDLNGLVRDVQRLLKRIIGEHIQLIFETTASEARIFADPGQVEQVLMNLGVNARDAMPAGGTLTFRTKNVHIDVDGCGVRGGEIEPGSYVCLEVVDTGSGMSDETKARIFEPFFTTKGPGRGTGLGLATVYGIVKQSQGAISVESELGCGCTFRVEFPQVRAEVAPSAPPPPPVEKAHAPAVILAVEDEEVVRTVICSVLEQVGYSVLCAATPAEAMEIADDFHGKIDLLLTDVVMPQMSGPALAHKMRPRFQQMKVIYISGYSERDMVEQGIDDGELRVLQKPFTQEVLLRRVKEVFEEKDEMLETAGTGAASSSTRDHMAGDMR